MSLDDAYSFDAEAFVAAAQALAGQALKAVTLPGLPPCFYRQLTAGDVLDAADIRSDLTAGGVEISRRVNIAIGLAQQLCGPAGQPIFDPRNKAHLATLEGLPWSSVRTLLSGSDGGDDGPNAQTDRSST